MQKSQTGQGKYLQNQEQFMMLLISVICSPLGLWLHLSWRASASWKWSRKVLEMGALRASALTGGWWGGNSHPEVSAGYTCTKLTLHQDAFAVRRHVWSSSEPRNLVILIDSTGEQSLLNPVQKKRLLWEQWHWHLGRPDSPHSKVTAIPVEEVSKKNCLLTHFVLWLKWCCRKLENGECHFLQDFFTTAWVDGFLVVTQVKNHMAFDMFTYSSSIAALGDVA